MTDVDLHEEQQALGNFWAFLIPPRRQRKRRVPKTSSAGNNLVAAAGGESLSIGARLGSRRFSGSIVAAAAAAKNLAGQRPSELDDPLIP